MAETITETPATKMWIAGHGNSHHGDHGVLEAINTNGYRAVDATVNAARALAKDVTDAGSMLTEAVFESADRTMRDVRKESEDTQVAVERNGRSAELAVEKTSAAVSLAVEKTGAAGQLNTALGFSNTQNLLISGFKDGRFDAATLTASILQSQVVGFKDARFDAASFAAQAALTAAQNFAAIQAQAAECCCELKEKIGAEADETRALINQIDRDRASRDLVAANAEILYLKSRLPSGTVV